MFKVRSPGKMPDKPMSVSPLRAELRRRITGSADKSIRQFCRKKLAELEMPREGNEPDTIFAIS